MARLYVANAAIADEVVQDTWLGVIRASGPSRADHRSRRGSSGFSSIAPERAPCARAGAHRSSALLSTESGADAGAVGEPGAALSGCPLRPLPPPLDPDSSPERSLLTKELRERLRTVIDALPPNLRIVLWLRDVEGWSSEEVCNALAIQETNQRVLLHRARSRARAALEPYLEGARGATRRR